MQQYYSLKTAVFLLVLIAIVSFSVTWLILTQKAPEITGLTTGTATVSVNPVVLLSLPDSSVDFGNLLQSGVNNTTDDLPSPFRVRNDGNTQLNISVRAASFLFTGSGSGNNTNKFRFMAGNTSNETNSFNWGNSAKTYTNFTDTDQKAIALLGYANTSDEAQIEIAILVPTDEGAGNKTADIVFTATQGS